MIVCLAISPSVDVTMLVDHLHVGTAHRPTSELRLAGGKGFNVARAIHRLAGDVVALGVVGGHAGRWLSHALAAEGVASSLIEGGNETRSCVSIADTATAQMTDFYPFATPMVPGEWQQLADECLRLVSSTAPGWLAISGSHPDGMPLDAISGLAAAAHRLGWRVAVDTSGPLLASALDAGVDLIKVNAAEAAAVVGHGDPGQLVDRLRRRAATAIVTNGADGAYAAGLHITATSRGAYPVGSGDTFLAGYLAACDRGPETALRLAVGAASANAEQPGAAVFDPVRARQLAKSAVLNPSAH